MLKGEFLKRMGNALIAKRTERLAKAMDVSNSKGRFFENDMLDLNDEVERNVWYARFVYLPELKAKARELRSFNDEAEYGGDWEHYR